MRSRDGGEEKQDAGDKGDAIDQEHRGSLPIVDVRRLDYVELSTAVAQDS